MRHIKPDLEELCLADLDEKVLNLSKLTSKRLKILSIIDSRIKKIILPYSTSIRKLYIENIEGLEEINTSTLPNLKVFEIK